METKAIGRQVYNPDICTMKIAVVAATNFEWMPIQKLVNELIDVPADTNITFHTIGIGMLASTYHLTALTTQYQPNIIIQAGIAGNFNQSLNVGNVVVVKNEFCGDLGVSENAGFMDVFDMNLVKQHDFPFEEKALPNPWLTRLNLTRVKEVNAVTVNEITTNKERIAALQKKYDCSTESMEGAALHYVCLQTKTPFIQIRSISNYIGERDKSKWNIKLALNELAASTTALIRLLSGAKLEALTGNISS